MKAVAEDGEPIYSKKDEAKLLALETSELEAMYFEMFNNELPDI